MKTRVILIIFLLSTNEGLSFLSKDEGLSFSVFKTKKLNLFGAPKYSNLFEVVQTNNLQECNKYFSVPDAKVNILDADGCSPLHLACNECEIAICRLLLEKGAQTEIRDTKYGFTPLHCACQRIRPEICKLLLDKGAQIEVLDKEGNTPLSWACFGGDEEMCKMLLEKGAQIEVACTRGKTPLIKACELGSVAVCKMLLEKKAKIDAQDSLGLTPLHHSTSLDDHGERCKLFIEKGANIEIRDNFGRTPLNLACWHGQLENCKLLILKGARLEAKDNDGRTPLYRACEHAHTELCRLLLEKGAQLEAKDNDGNTPLHVACMKDQIEICRLLLKKGAQIDVQDKKYGFTPLHWACKGGLDDGYEDICRLLLEKGAQTEIRDTKYGFTPLHWACGNGHLEVCKLLLEKRAQIEAQDNGGNTPLFLACEKGHLEVCKLLLEKGVQIDIQNKKGWTPLHIVCKTGNASLGGLLLKKGSEINARTVKSETPLMIACKEGHKEVMYMLLADKRLKKELKDDVLEGTALHWACKYNHLELCTELLRAGFSANETANTLSLLHLAVKTGNLQLVEFFLEKQSDSNKADKNGITALHLSCELGIDNITEELLIRKDRYGIKINAESLRKKTPLHSAVEANQERSVRLLLKYGALPNEADSSNKTPLMYAAEKRYLEICRLIQDKLSISQFNEIKYFLWSLVRGHKELEELFGVYSELSVVPHSDSVTHEDAQGVQGLRSSQDLPDRGVSSSLVYVSEQNFSEEKANDGIIDQVSDDEEEVE